MLHMDQHYASTLGRPLGISGIGDCPPPTPLTTNSAVLRLATYINQFTILARQILSCDELDNTKIDDFSDRLLQLLDTLPAVIQFEESWLEPDREIPEWPLEAHAAMFFSKTHNYLILLNRQRQENTERESYQQSPNQTQPLPDGDIRNQDRRGYNRILKSCRELLKAFTFFKLRLRPAMMCWTMGQQAFNAAMILTVSMVETGSTADWSAVSRAYYTFAEMRDKGIHQLARLACERLMDLFKNLRNADTKEKVMSQNGMVLLEDPGLQGFIPEKYRPLTFQMAGTDIPLSLENGPSWAVEDWGRKPAKRRRYNFNGGMETTSNIHDEKGECSPVKPLDFLGRFGAPFDDMMGTVCQYPTLDDGCQIKRYAESVASSSCVGDCSASTSQCGDVLIVPYGTATQQWS
jgi:hypothetical protein